MKKRGRLNFLFTVLIILVLNSSVGLSENGDDIVIGDTIGQDIGGPSDEELGESIGDLFAGKTTDAVDTGGRLIKTEPDSGPVKSATVSGSVFVDDEGIHATQVDEAELEGGVTVEGATGVTLGNDGSVSVDTAESYTSGTITGSGLSDAVFWADGSYSVGRADSFSHGDVVITKGTNFVFSDGTLVIEKADSTFMGLDWATDVDMLSVKNNTFSVDHAEQVKVGCVVATNVLNSDFDLTQGVNIVSKTGTSYSLEDCAGNNVKYTSKGSNNEILITLDENKPIYVATDVELVFEKFNETIETNGTVIVQTDRDFGVESIYIDTPSATYDVKTGDRRNDYSFRAWKEGHTIYIRKDAVQMINENCKNCTIVDFPNERINIRGTIDYKRNLFSGNKIIEEGVTIFATNKGEAILQMSKDFRYVEELLIITDTPPYITRPNNYLTIYETPIGSETHRLIDINEHLQPQDVAEPIIKNYRTIYSSATMFFTEKVLEYRRTGFTARILPPGHKEITQIQNDMLGISSALALSALAFTPIFYRRKNKMKKGQVTMFIVIGLILLIFMGLAFFSFADIKQIKKTYIFDKTGVNAYFNQCFKQTLTDGTKLLGAQGTDINLEVPFFPDLRTKHLYNKGLNLVPGISNQEEKLETYVNNKILNCMIEFKKNFVGVNITRVQSPSSKITIRQKDIFGELDWFFTAVKGEQILSFNKFATPKPVDIRYLKILDLVNLTVESQINNEKRFDMDLYNGNNFELIIFPLNQVLATLIKDHDFLAEYEPYKFLFANLR